MADLCDRRHWLRVRYLRTAHAAAHHREAFVNDVVRIDVVRAGDTAATRSVNGRLAGGAGALRRAATTLIDLGDLPRGAYIIRVSLETRDGAVLTQASRWFQKH